MDPVMIEKLHAMKRFKRKRSLLHRLIHFLLTVISFGLFLSCPLWLPKVCSVLKTLLFVWLPNARAVLFGPKCLFIICNLIVVLLLGESKFRGDEAPAPDIYDEYEKRNRSMARRVVVEKDEKVVMEEEEEEEEVMGGGSGDEGEEEEEVYGDDESGLPEPEELKKMADDFIARFNKQRMLEERMLVRRG